MTEAVQYRAGDGVAAAAAPEATDRHDGGPGAIAHTDPGGDAWGSEHPVNVRLTIPLLFGRYYVTLVAGRERRGPERLASERRKHPLETAGNIVFALFVGTVLALAILMAIRLVVLATDHFTGAPPVVAP